MRRFVCLLGLLVLVKYGVAQKADSTIKGPTFVAVDGLVDSSFSISNANLDRFTITEGKNIPVTGPKGDVKYTISSFKGILLTEILSKAKISLAKEKDRGKYVVVVTASDGYTVSFTYNELMFAAAGKNTYLLFEEDGKPIDKSGPFIVLCTSDLITGPRHVKWVKEITVKKID